MNVRQEKINELFKQEISKIILKEIKDPRLGFVTVQRVETSRDMSYAKVYITILGGESDVKKSLSVLNGAKEFIRVQLQKKIDMRYIPAPEFLIDTKIDDTLKLLNIIEKDKEEHGYE
ncbi:MAG: 30S ribosome-binding factor RbfA [Abditibacteriota bacterium]|nr:30S ribosome-binding factor RbfA [Abditibacteriota bacterium]